MTSPDGLVDMSTASGSIAPETSSPRTNRTAIAALVASVVTLLGVGSIIGIWLGVYALNQIRVSGENGRGLALAGIFVGSITLLVSMIVIVMGLSSW